MRRLLSARTASAFMLTLATACSGGSDTPQGPSTPPPAAPTPPTQPSNTVSSVVVTPDSALLARDGESVQFTARALNAQGSVVSGATITWLVADTTIARVDAAGLVTSRAVGQTSVVATAASVTGMRAIRVVLQRNAACLAPAAPQSPGAIRGTPTWSLRTVQAPLPPYLQNDIGVLDLDADGDRDVVVASWRLPSEQGYTGTMRAWRNIGGDLQDATASVFGATQPVADHPLALLTGDYDRDGREDLYVPQQGFDAAPFPGASNILLLQRTAGTLSDVSAANLSPNERTVTHWGATGDVDCDGDLDLYEANIGGVGPPRLMRNNGSGAFTSASLLPSAMTSLAQRYTSAAFCDVDRDGDQDLVLGGWFRRDDLLLNDGFGQFRYAPASAMPDPFFPVAAKATTHVYCVDMDRDGWPDVVTNTTDNYTAGRVTIYRNRRDGTFEDRTATVPQQLREWYSKVYVADFNGDGYPDILASQPFERAGSPGGEALWINQGSQDFIETTLPTSIQYARLFPLDLDGDGRLDILAIDPGKGRVQLLRNTAP